MDEIKVSQLDAVDEVRDTDVIMEISGGANKKATIQQVKDNIVKDEYGTSQENTYSQEYINGKTLGTSLYSNSSGTHEAFTLSEDIKHFREIEVTFGRSSWTNMKQKLRVVPQQSGTTPCGLFAMYPSSTSNEIVVGGALMEIGSGGTNVAFPRMLAGSITSNGYQAESNIYLNVYEVVGYK